MLRDKGGRWWQWNLTEKCDSSCTLDIKSLARVVPARPVVLSVRRHIVILMKRNINITPLGGPAVPENMWLVREAAIKIIVTDTKILSGFNCHAKKKMSKHVCSLFKVYLNSVCSPITMGFFWSNTAEYSLFTFICFLSFITYWQTCKKNVFPVGPLKWKIRNRPVVVRTVATCTSARWHWRRLSNSALL